MPPSCTSRTHPPTQNRRPEAHQPDGLKIMQRQVGHAYQSTTGLYTAVSGAFANKMMRNAVSGLLEAANNRRGSE